MLTIDGKKYKLNMDELMNYITTPIPNKHKSKSNTEIIETYYVNAIKDVDLNTREIREVKVNSSQISEIKHDIVRLMIEQVFRMQLPEATELGDVIAFNTLINMNILIIEE